MATRAVFRDWDGDGSGAIDPQEFCSALRRGGLELSKEQVDSLFACIDRDASGSISFRELNKVVRLDVEKEARERRRQEMAARREAFERAQYEELIDGKMELIY